MASPYEHTPTRHTYDLSFVDDMPAVHPASRLIEEGDNAWRRNNSSFEEYMEDAPFPSHYSGLIGIIDDVIGYDAGNVGMDLAGGSQGIALRDLLDEGLISKGLVTNYQDLRTAATKADKRVGHVAGDLAEVETWHNIIQWQSQHAPGGFALITYRPFGGLQGFAPHVYTRAAHTLLDMLRPGGLLFTQVPKIFHAQHKELCTAYRGLRANPDVAKIIPSARSPYYDGRNIFGVIIKTTVDNT